MNQQIIEKITHMNTDHNHHQETDRLWQESEELPFICGLREGKTAAEIMESIDAEPAYKRECHEAGCADGRCQGHRLGVAGNGILLSAEDLNKFVDKNRGRIRRVFSHDGCGAAAIKFKATRPEDLPTDVSTADQLGIHYSQDLAKRLGAEYGHVPACDMSGPVHNERAIYLDGTGRFNPKALPELPAGFMCSGPALGLDNEYMKKEIETLAKIALGDHGFGKRFTRENPLYVVVSAAKDQQLEELKRVADKAALKFDGRLAVDGFLAN